MRQQKLQFLICILCALFPLLSQAQITLRGTVTNESGSPLPGVNIRIDNSLTGGTTNGQGEFRIAGLPEGNYVLNFSYLGYKPQKYTADGSQDNIRIILKETDNRLQQIVVTGTGTHRRMADSPVPITVLTAKDIASANAPTLEEALTKLTPNVSMFTNGMGTTMSLNGINEDYVVILENGRRLSGDDRYTRINMANVKRIEILNGAASALYGSDAIGGVINIITDDAKNTVDASNYTHVGSHGRLTESVNADVNAGWFSSSTSYQRTQSDGWQNNGVDEDGNPTGRPTSVGYFNDNVSQRFTFRPSNRLSFSVYGTWYDYETRRPQAATYYSKGQERAAYTYDLRHETYTYGASMKYIISPKAYLTGEYYSDNYASSYKYFAKSGSNQPGDEVVRKQTRYNNANVKGIFRLGSHNRLTTGLEYVGDHLESESDNIAGEDMYTLSAFAQDEITLLKNLQAVVGLRYSYNENFGSHATPNASLMYRHGGLNVRAAYAAGFRTPTLQQVYATSTSTTKSLLTVGNPNLDPEKSNFYSLNVEYAWHGLSLSVTGFINDVKDMINYRMLSAEEVADLHLTGDDAEFDNVQQRDNVDRAKTQGITANLRYSPGWGVTVGGGYTYLDTEAKERLEDGTYEVTPIDKSLRHTGNLFGQWEHTWGIYHLNVNLQGRLQGERFSQSYGYAPKFQQWNLNTTHTINLRKFILEPGIGIENLFNDRDMRPWNNNFSTLNPGRSVYVSLLVRFKS